MQKEKEETKITEKKNVVEKKDNKKSKEINFKKINFSAIVKNEAIFLNDKNWIFTILFFILILFFSIWIWEECILNPVPNEKTITDLKQKENSIIEKIKKNEEVIEKIKQRKEEFLDFSDFNGRKEIFKNKLNTEYLEKKGNLNTIL